MLIKRCLGILAFILMFQNSVKAESLYTTVFNVFESEKTQRLLVLSGADGRIYKSPKSEANLLKMKSLIGEVVKLDYSIAGSEAVITKIEKARSNEVSPETMDLNHFRYNQLRTFAPTDLQTFENAVTIFDGLLNDGDKGRSECFKRAHMWAFDMWSKLNITSEKIFIFYTKRYSILEDFDWWFHVAPMVTVAGVEYVMDGTFMKKPITVQDWKNYFIKSDQITCPQIDSIQEYDKNQWTKLCHIMKVPMYYLSPLNIRERDEKGVARNNWILEELQDARRAFRNWSETYEGLDTGKPTIKY